MSGVHTNRLIEEYLRRLDAAAAGLPAGRRAELVSEIRGHVEDALEAAGTREEAAARNVLDRLGAPEEIAAAAIDTSPAPAAVATPTPDGQKHGPPGRRMGGLEIAAIMTLIAGGFIVPSDDPPARWSGLKMGARPAWGLVQSMVGEWQ